MDATFTVYFAGPLFNHKDLIGNALLASYVEQAAAGRYACVLPQDAEQSGAQAVDIRNHDLRQVMACDLALFNFDGSELDAGTVVEFMFAKFLDIPAVLLRSDFRAAGDQGAAGEAWNLMCSFYPRTKVVQFDALAWYQQARQALGPFSAQGSLAPSTPLPGQGEGKQGETLQDVLQRLYGRIAAAVVESLDAVRHEPPLPKGTPADVERLYRWAMRFPGGGFEAACTAAVRVAQLVAEKQAKGLA
jgi:nucleoside 2-deoxyribosyltransferase